MHSRVEDIIVCIHIYIYVYVCVCVCVCIYRDLPWVLVLVDIVCTGSVLGMHSCRSDFHFFS